MTAGWGEPRDDFGDESGVEYRDESEDESIFSGLRQVRKQTMMAATAVDRSRNGDQRLLTAASLSGFNEHRNRVWLQRMTAATRDNHSL